MNYVVRRTIGNTPDFVLFASDLQIACEKLDEQFTEDKKYLQILFPDLRIKTAHRANAVLVKFICPIPVTLALLPCYE